MVAYQHTRMPHARLFLALIGAEIVRWREGVKRSGVRLE
jgi:hypothetical protein